MESKYFVIDLSNKTELEKLYTLTKNLRIDILVLNAGLTHVSDFIQTKPKQIETILNLNIFSYQNLIHHYVMPMVER
jgi:short-subunit dehydrogenase